MARVTVEDCVKLIPNRFELSLVAGRRAKDLLLGAPALIDKKNEKYTVTALREIGGELVDLDKVKKELDNEIKGKKITDYGDSNLKKLINTEIEEVSKSEGEIIDSSEIDEDEIYEDDSLENETEEEVGEDSEEDI